MNLLGVKSETGAEVDGLACSFSSTSSSSYGHDIDQVPQNGHCMYLGMAFSESQPPVLPNRRPSSSLRRVTVEWVQHPRGVDFHHRRLLSSVWTDNGTNGLLGVCFDTPSPSNAGDRVLPHLRPVSSYQIYYTLRISSCKGAPNNQGIIPLPTRLADSLRRPRHCATK